MLLAPGSLAGMLAPSMSLGIRSLRHRRIIYLHVGKNQEPVTGTLKQVFMGDRCCCRRAYCFFCEQDTGSAVRLRRLQRPFPESQTHPLWGEAQMGKNTCGLVSPLSIVRLDRQHNETLNVANRPWGAPRQVSH
ncbi:hypothetical protein DEDE109153_03870 [Deinococcus deserti]